MSDEAAPNFLSDSESTTARLADYLNQLPKIGLDAIWCDRDTILRSRVWSSFGTATDNYEVAYTFLELNGAITNRVVRGTPNTDRSVANIDATPGIGYMLSFLIRFRDNSARRGQVYVELDMFNIKDGMNREKVTAGYITGARRIGMNPRLDEDMVSGKGYINSVAGTDPAAGAEVSESVPTNARYLLKSIEVTLVTSSTAANRQLILIIDDGTTEIMRCVSSAAQAASSTVQYIFGSWEEKPTNTATTYFISIPDNLELPQGYRIRTSTTNLQSGDNYGAPQYAVEEWIEE